jgi:hypothetical protein
VSRGVYRYLLGWLRQIGSGEWNVYLCCCERGNDTLRVLDGRLNQSIDFVQVGVVSAPVSCYGRPLQRGMRYYGTGLLGGDPYCRRA